METEELKNDEIMENGFSNEEHEKMLSAFLQMIFDDAECE